MHLTIRGRDLPGAAFGPYANVHVGLQLGREATGLVRGDAPGAAWETVIDQVGTADGVDFRGPAVQGRRAQRFLYLTWGEVDGSAFTMFRRAKLMLADLPAELAGEGAVAVEVSLTGADGSARCARIPPALLRWERPAR